MKVYLYERGDFWCSPTDRRIFATLELAQAHVPSSYKDRSTCFNLYFEDENREEWTSITEFEVQD